MKSLFLVIFFMSPSLAFAETTNPGTSAFGSEYTEDPGTAGRSICRIRIRDRNYNIRKGAGHRSYGKCGANNLSNTDLTSIQPLNFVSTGKKGWISFAHKGCPQGIGYVHVNALNFEDVNNFQSGNCGVGMRYGYRQAPSAPVIQSPSVTSVLPLGGNRDRFPLDRCLGLKNGGGHGHYGASRGGGTRRHSGCDYYSPQGTPVKSPCVGKVVKSAPPTGARRGDPGARVWVQCDNGNSFRMLHLHSSPRRIANGSRVNIGTVLGGVGKSGNARAQAPHLHLEARIRGRLTDPQRLWSCGGKSGH